MDLNSILNQIWQLLLRIGAAAIVFLIGWVIAKIIAALVGRLLKWLKLDERISKAAKSGKMPQLELIIVKAIYYLIVLVALTAALQVLGLTLITEPLNALISAIFAFIPKLIAGVVVGVVAWLVATILRSIVRTLLDGVQFDKKVADNAGTKSEWQLGRAVGEIVYWLVWLLFLPVIFTAMGMEALVAPVMDLIGQLLGWIPNLIIAAFIVVVGYFVARILQRVVSAFFAALGTDKLADRIGLTKYMGKLTLSGLIGLVVLIIVMIPVITAALQALQLAALTAPLTAMLTSVLVAIPILIMAVAVIVVAVFVGRVVGDFVADLLNGLGFDNVLVRLGLAKAGGESNRMPSKTAGALVTVAIILLAAMSAFTWLRLDPLAQLLSDFITFAVRILIGLVIFGVGLWLATWVSNFVMGSNWPRKYLLALVGRISVIALSLAIALGTMGLADSIIAIAFGAPLIGFALAIGLAFGLGGQAAAAKQLDNWQASIASVDQRLAEASQAEAAAQAPTEIAPPAEADAPQSDPTA